MGCPRHKVGEDAIDIMDLSEDSINVIKGDVEHLFGDIFASSLLGMSKPKADKLEACFQKIVTVQRSL